MLLISFSSALPLTMASAALAQNYPVNEAGYTTVTLAEAGLTQFGPHDPSDTETSTDRARVVRRSGQTTDTAQEQQPAQRGRSPERQPTGRTSR